MNDRFSRFARLVERAAGSPWSFIAAGGAIVLWGACGPIFGWSDGWQLVCNTGTTIISFLMLFLIQGTQNRNTAALHLKLDEIIRVLPARNDLMLSEHLDEEAQRDMKRQFERLAKSRVGGQ